MPRLNPTFLRALDTNADASAGAFLYVYQAGTTTAVTTYSDKAMSVANASPVVADASGAFGDVYLPSGFYKVNVTDAAGVVLPGLPRDNIFVADSLASAPDLEAAQTQRIYPQLEVELSGYLAEGDNGGGRFAYSASEPGHPGKFQDAGGYWFERQDLEVRIEMFGGASDASEYVDDELEDLIAYCVAKPADWRHVGDIKLSSDHIIPDTFRIIGYGARSRSATDGNRHRSAIGLNSDAQLRVRDDTGEDGTVGDGVCEDVLFYDLETGTTPANRQGYYAKPLLEIGRSSGWTMRRVTFDGKGLRRYGVWCGKGNTMWASTLDQVAGINCAVGIYVGGPNDATNVHINNCTAAGCIHGIVVENPRAGSLRDCNPEGNEGVGIAVLITSAGSDFSVTNCYTYNNGQGVGFDAEDAGAIMILGPGEELPWTDWTTSGVNEIVAGAGAAGTPYGCEVAHCYTVGGSPKYGLWFGGQRGGYIHRNRLEGETADLCLSAGAGADTIVDSNWPQSGTSLSIIETNGYRVPVVANAGTDGSVVNTLGDTGFSATATVSFGEAGSVSAAGLFIGAADDSKNDIAAFIPLHVDHTGGGTTNVLDLSAALPSGTVGFFEVVLAITQTAADRNHQVVKLEIHTDLSDGAGSTDVNATIVTESKYPTSRDGRSFSISSGVLQMSGTNNAYVDGHARVTASRY